MGDPAILVNAYRDGMRLFQSAVRSAHESGEATFEFDAIMHHVVRQEGAADIEVGAQTVVWRFDDAIKPNRALPHPFPRRPQQRWTAMLLRGSAVPE
jgi:hypothetical protein